MSFRRFTPALVASLGLLSLLPAGASARKHPSPNGRHSVSIAVSQNPTVAGDPLAIYGRLVGPNHANRPVTLWHRVNPARRFTPIQHVRTDSNGFYLINRADGVVDSNRNWYVKSLNARSRTIHERVFSLVTLSGPAAGSNLLTGPANKVTFTGTVSGAIHRGERVILQRQNASTGGDDWHRIQSAVAVGPGGRFTIVHTFVVPGDANIRVLVLGTRRHLPSPSSPIQYQIQQAQNANLTINASADPITVGQSTVISGVLAGGANQPVTLLAHTDRQAFAPIAQTTADGSGHYTFAPQAPINSTTYQVSGGGMSSAVLFLGVGDVLTAGVSATSVQAGQTVTFSGSVSPDKTGHLILLQRQNAAGGDFHTVQVAVVGAGSVYSIVHRVFVPGTKVFRVLIGGGPENRGAASQPFSITVTPATAAALPTQGLSGATVGSTSVGSTVAG